MKPIIKIRYARAIDRYCEILSKSDWQEPYRKIMGDLSYPNKDILSKKVSEYQKAWDEVEDLVLYGVTNFTGLEFDEKEVSVYVVGFGRAHSDPLVIPSNFNSDEFVNVLVHELIHRLFSFNNRGIDEDILSPKLFPNENEPTAIHTVLHSVLKYVYIDILKNPERLEWELKRAEGDYKKSWEIVNKKGYLNIINEFISKF